MCYNYTMPYYSHNKLGVAIAMQKFESNYSPDLYFSVKPLMAEISTIIPFVIRTQWKYTTWSKFSFQFLVESRIDIEAGYY